MKTFGQRSDPKWESISVGSEQRSHSQVKNLLLRNFSLLAAVDMRGEQYVMVSSSPASMSLLANW